MNSYKNIDTVCPYCGTGCVITCTVNTETNRVIEAKGSPQGVNNEGRLCLKGLYGWDYLNDPQILTKRIRHPMIRKGGKGSPLVAVSWQEAIEYTASGPSSKNTAPTPSWVPARPAAPEMKSLISPRSLCAPSLAPTTSTTVPASATAHPLPV